MQKKKKERKKKRKRVEKKKCMDELLCDGFISKQDVAVRCSEQPTLMVLIR